MYQFATREDTSGSACGSLWKGGRALLTQKLDIIRKECGRISENESVLGRRMKMRIK